MKGLQGTVAVSLVRWEHWVLHTLSPAGPRTGTAGDGFDAAAGPVCCVAHIRCFPKDAIAGVIRWEQLCLEQGLKGAGEEQL